jgi:transposase InsO family protein
VVHISTGLDTQRTGVHESGGLQFSRRSAWMTYIRTWEGWLYLASVMDLYSRRIVGWALAEHLRAEFVLDALEMAVVRHRPDAGLVHHSDQGRQPGLNRSSQRVSVR